MTGSTLKVEIHEQLTDAMKAGDKVRVGALRMLLSAIRYKEDELGHELTDDEVREVAGKEVKKRGESIEAFDGAGRTELADKERAERDVLSRHGRRRNWTTRPSTRSWIEALAATGATSVPPSWAR